jgi:hypothetical protein
MAGDTPSTANRFEVIDSPVSCSGGPALVKLFEMVSTPARPSNERVSRT